MLYLAIGRRELGKTTLVTSLARKVPQRIILDPRRMVRNPAAMRASTDAEITDSVTALFEDPTISELIITPVAKVQSSFDMLCRNVRWWIQQDESRPLAVILDEMRFINTDGPGADAFDFMLRCAPRDVVHIFMTCHRPTDVTVDVRAIVDHWLMFQCSQKHDLQAIRERAGDVAADAVQGLQPYEWVQWDDARGKLREHKTPSVWFIPLRETGAAAGAVDTFAGMPSTDPMMKGRLFG